jgi:hypothetical protein
VAYLGVQYGRQAMENDTWEKRSKDIDSFYQLFGSEINYNLETENKNPLVVVYGALAAAVDAAFLHAPSNTDAMYVIHNLLNKKLTDLLGYND